MDQGLRAAFSAEKVRSFGDSPSISWGVYAVSIIAFCMCDASGERRKKTEDREAQGKGQWSLTELGGQVQDLRREACPHLNPEKVLEGPETFDIAAFLLGTVVMEWSREVMEHKDKASQGKPRGLTVGPFSCVCSISGQD